MSGNVLLPTVADTGNLQYNERGRLLWAARTLTAWSAAMFDHLTINRFWGKVDKADTGKCWPWLAAHAHNGYGVFWLGPPWRKHIKAHRFSYIIHNAPLGDGDCVLHKCDNPTCVNPTHLWAGSHRDNMVDMAQKGRCKTSRGMDASWRKLDIEQVRYIRDSAEVGTVLARRFGVSKSTIYAVRDGKNWKGIS